MPFETFDLGRVIQTSEAIKDMRRRSTTDALREQYMGEQIQGMRSGRERQEKLDAMNFGKERATQEYARAGYIMEADDPKGLIETQYPDIMEMVTKAGQDWATVTPEQLKQSAKLMRAKAGAEAGIDSGNLTERENLTMQSDIEDKRLQGQREFSTSQQEDQQAFIAQQNAMNRDARAGRSLNKPPAGYRWTPDGNLEAIPGGPAIPKANTGNVTEGERKAAALGTRLDAALTTLNEITVRDPAASKPGLIERGLESAGMEAAANFSRSDERQQADSAQLDALDAALTLATGAAYTKEQLMNLRKSYFPQIGDSDPTVAAKQKRFETIVKTARIASGRAEPSIDRANQPGHGASGSWGEPGQETKMGGFTVRRVK